MQNSVKAKLARGEATVGTWTMIGHPSVAEILARAGFDWVVLDIEHGMPDWPRALGQIQAVQGQACAALCRLPVNAPEHFKWALDLGAEGVMVPFVQTAEDAAGAVAAAKYPPEGMRGVGVCRAHQYGAAFQEYVDTANEQTLVILQIEHIEAVHNIEAICAVPGVDVVFVGPYDLSGSMDLMGQVHHPDVEEAVDHVLHVAQAAGVAPGLLIAEPRPGELKAKIDEGFRFIAAGLDTLMLVRAAESLVRQWRQA
ncbi:MAG: HpcH/HpaI aldolase family protein [Anaerolineae bacterium]